jgi:hypothetical protein
VSSNFGAVGAGPPPCGSLPPGSGGGITCRLSSLGVGAGNAWVITLVLTVQAGAVSPISNTASASSPTPDPVMANNTDTETTTIEPTTAVTLRSFAAGRQNRGVLLRWQVATELGVAGYHVYREGDGGRLSRATPRLLPSRGLGARRYSWLDRAAPKQRPVAYRLQAVYLDGRREWIARTVAARR